jgi:hypothetical protein
VTQKATASTVLVQTDVEKKDTVIVAAPVDVNQPCEGTLLAIVNYADGGSVLILRQPLEGVLAKKEAELQSERLKLMERDEELRAANKLLKEHKEALDRADESYRNYSEAYRTASAKTEELRGKLQIFENDIAKIRRAIGDVQMKKILDEAT